MRPFSTPSTMHTTNTCPFRIWRSSGQHLRTPFVTDRKIYLAAPSLEHVGNDHDAHTTYTAIQLRVYYRTVPDMQHPTPTYGSIALPEYLSSHGTTTRTDTPVNVIEPPQNTHTRKTWPTSDRPHDIELLRQYHRINHIICQRFQSNPDEGGAPHGQTYIERRIFRFVS